VKHLDQFFAGYRAASIGQPEVNRYITARRREGAVDATIRRELGTLTKMLRVAFKNRKLLRLPLLEKPKEGPPREGFFEREQYEAVRAHLAPDLQLATGIAYTFGWRTQSEVLVLERRQVDLDVGTLRLDTGSTKNDDGRLVYLPPDLRAQLAVQAERVRALEHKVGRIIPYLFPHLRGPYKGERRRDFRKTWTTACRKAGVPRKLRHDFRRTAVRNMVNAGVPERVAMKVTGHKTRSVFDRYHIVSPADLEDVARKLTGITAGITTGSGSGAVS
jgi:integrase